MFNSVDLIQVWDSHKWAESGRDVGDHCGATKHDGGRVASEWSHYLLPAQSGGLSHREQEEVTHTITAQRFYVGR